MHAKLAVGLTMLLSFGAAMVPAQDTAPAPVAAAASVPGNSPDYSAVNCSGFISEKVPDDLRVISSEQSNVKVIFSTNDYIYINRGRDKGVQVGDRFSVVRPEKDPVKVPWFKWQTKLLKAMGEQYADLGQVRVVNVQANVSVAQVNFTCDYMQRGDLLRPFVERPTPTYKDTSTFDRFAPVNGKHVAMIVEGGTIGQASGRNTSVFVNLGTNQGVHIGDYYRIFRHQGTMAETVPQTKGYAYQLFGFGSAPAKYEWKDLPREVIGEGIVINASQNASTMLITYSALEVYSGDYVEVE